MHELSDADKILYFQRSYVAVDGLWFMKVEDTRGFEEALDRDCAVWGVMPKIQARALKSMIGVDRGLDALRQCLSAKFKAEGFQFTSSDLGDKGIAFTISVCPWYDTLVKAGRSQLAAKVGESVCTTEYTVWANEFGKSIRFRMGDRLCNGEQCCCLSFYEDKI